MSNISAEVSRQLAEQLPELKAAAHRQVMSDIRGLITSLVKKELEIQLDAIIDAAIDEKLVAAERKLTKDVSNNVAKSQLALVKASHDDVMKKVSVNLATVINRDVMPKIDGFMSTAALNMQDHTEMVTQYRRNVHDGHLNAARDAVRNSHANALGKGRASTPALMPSNNQRGAPPPPVKFMLE